MPTLFNILLTLQFHILFNIPSYLIDPTLLFALNDDLYPEFRIPKAELLQLKLTPIICLMNFINKKVGNPKN